MDHVVFDGSLKEGSVSLGYGDGPFLSVHLASVAMPWALGKPAGDGSGVRPAYVMGLEDIQTGQLVDMGSSQPRNASIRQGVREP